jgi:hypothetical protein
MLARSSSTADAAVSKVCRRRGSYRIAQRHLHADSFDADRLSLVSWSGGFVSSDVKGLRVRRAGAAAPAPRSPVRGMEVGLHFTHR